MYNVVRCSTPLHQMGNK